MILFYLFDCFHFACIVHGFKGTGTHGAVPCNWYTLLTQEKKKTIKFLTVCDFITSGTACSILWNVPFPHCHLRHFLIVCFHASEEIKTKKVSLCNQYPHPWKRRQPNFKLMQMSALWSCCV